MANVLKELMHSDDHRDVTFGPHIYERMKTLYSIWSCVSLYTFLDLIKNYLKFLMNFVFSGLLLKAPQVIISQLEP